MKQEKLSINNVDNDEIKKLLKSLVCKLEGGEVYFVIEAEDESSDPVVKMDLSEFVNNFFTKFGCPISYYDVIGLLANIKDGEGKLPKSILKSIINFKITNLSITKIVGDFGYLDPENEKDLFLSVLGKCVGDLGYGIKNFIGDNKTLKINQDEFDSYKKVLGDSKFDRYDEQIKIIIKPVDNDDKGEVSKRNEVVKDFLCNVNNRGNAHYFKNFFSEDDFKCVFRDYAISKMRDKYRELPIQQHVQMEEKLEQEKEKLSKAAESKSDKNFLAAYNQAISDLEKAVSENKMAEENKSKNTTACSTSLQKISEKIEQFNKEREKEETHYKKMFLYRLNSALWEIVGKLKKADLTVQENEYNETIQKFEKEAEDVENAARKSGIFCNFAPVSPLTVGCHKNNYGTP